MDFPPSTRASRAAPSTPLQAAFLAPFGAGKCWEEVEKMIGKMLGKCWGNAGNIVKNIWDNDDNETFGRKSSANGLNVARVSRA